MEEKTMYIIESGPTWFNPNMYEGQLNKWGMVIPKGEGSTGEIVVNGKCEIDGTVYYRSAVDNSSTENLTIIVEASLLSDTPPAEAPAEETTSTDTSSDSWISGGTWEDVKDLFPEGTNPDDYVLTDEMIESMWAEPNVDYSDPEVQAALDAMDGMIGQ